TKLGSSLNTGLNLRYKKPLHKGHVRGSKYLEPA
ncbi:hypothetical protein Trydic_g18292, partial [Trypoxylus dichotomus]